jgi:hypothetical protein
MRSRSAKAAATWSPSSACSRCSLDTCSSPSSCPSSVSSCVGPSPAVVLPAWSAWTWALPCCSSSCWKAAASCPCSPQRSDSWKGARHRGQHSWRPPPGSIGGSASCGGLATGKGVKLQVLLQHFTLHRHCGGAYPQIDKPAQLWVHNTRCALLRQLHCSTR